MSKKIVSIILVLVLCFSFMTVAAFADNILDEITTTGNGVNFDGFRNTFKISPAISQLLEMFHLDGIWNVVMNIISTIRGIDAIM